MVHHVTVTWNTPYMDETTTIATIVTVSELVDHNNYNKVLAKYQFRFCSWNHLIPSLNLRHQKEKGMLWSTRSGENAFGFIKDDGTSIFNICNMHYCSNAQQPTIVYLLLNWNSCHHSTASVTAACWYLYSCTICNSTLGDIHTAYSYHRA